MDFLDPDEPDEEELERIVRNRLSEDQSFGVSVDYESPVAYVHLVGNDLEERPNLEPIIRGVAGELDIQKCSATVNGDYAEGEYTVAIKSKNV